MALNHPRLKLGKSAAFVKTHLKRLPQVQEIWEADFRALPRPADCGRQFPALDQWVRESGWIEVGRQKGAGFVARALDDGGVAFENNSSTTLAEALAALEEGLAGRFGK